MLKMEDIMFRRPSLLHATFCGLLHKMVGDDLKSVLINVRQITQAGVFFKIFSVKGRDEPLASWETPVCTKWVPILMASRYAKGARPVFQCAWVSMGTPLHSLSIAGRSVLVRSGVRMPPASSTWIASTPPFSTFHYLAPSLCSRPKGDNHHIMGCVYHWHTRQNRL